MYCTKNHKAGIFPRHLFLAVPLLLAGCAGVPVDNANTAAPATTTGTEKHLAVDEIQRYRQAITYLNDNQLDRAEALLTEIITSRPELAGPWTNMALVYVRKNNLDKAQETLERALERNPDMPQAYNLLGYIEKKHGNINKAKAHFQKAVTTKPDYAIAHYNLALLYDVYLQDIPNAIVHYKKYLGLTGEADQNTVNWVNELERSLTRGES